MSFEGRFNAVGSNDILEFDSESISYGSSNLFYLVQRTRNESFTSGILLAANCFVIGQFNA